MNLKTELMKHQQMAFDKLKNIKACALFMDMGTGKTRTVLEFAEYRREKGRLDKVFWLCPVSTKLNLKLDIFKHSNYSTAYIEKYTNEFICICGIQTLSSSTKMYTKLRDLIKKNQKCLFVVDESHLIKNPNAKRTKRITELSKSAEYRAVLTGTPITQGIWDLYTQMFVLHPDILGYNSWYAFAREHIVYSDKYPGMITKVHNPDYITKCINPYVYQVTKKECLDLPEKNYQNRYFDMSKYQKDIYNTVKCIMLDKINVDEFNSYVIFEMLTYLQRIASGYFKMKLNGMEFDFQDNRRAEVVQEVLEGINLKDNKVVIWYKYNTDLEIIKQNIEEKYVMLNGTMREKQKEMSLIEFRNGNTNILIANVNCGSFGLNLQEANYMIYYNNVFDYAKRVQSEDRIYRFGQSKNCHMIDIIAYSSIDQKIENCIKRKSSLAREVRERLNKIKDDKAEIEKFKKEILKEW